MSLHDLDHIIRNDLDDLTKKVDSIYDSYKALIRAAEVVCENADILEEDTIYNASARVVSVELLDNLLTAIRDAE